MGREAVNHYFKLIVQKGLTVGLDNEDYQALVGLLSFLKPSDELYQKINAVIGKILSDVNFFGYGKECIDYISSHTYLLPLVLANNDKKVCLSGDNSYLFWCQFHTEEKPQMSVSDAKNLLHCFGCNCSFNVITYLKAVEHMNFYGVLDALTRIFCLEDTAESHTDMILKYQRMILHPDYARWLTEGFDRLIKRGVSSIDGVDINQIYMQRFGTIMRVRRKEVDENFMLLRKKQKVMLKMEEE